MSSIHLITEQLQKKLFETTEYQTVIALFKEIQNDEESYNLLKNNKDIQKNLQLKVQQGGSLTLEDQEMLKQSQMALLTNEKIKQLSTAELEVNKLLQNVLKDLIKPITELNKEK